MPIYEYACGRCKKRSSALLSRYDSPDPACPHCGSRRVRRLVSSFATTRPQDGGEDLGGAGGGGDFGGGDFGGGDFGGGDFGGGDFGGGDFGGDDFGADDF